MSKRQWVAQGSVFVSKGTSYIYISYNTVTLSIKLLTSHGCNNIYEKEEEEKKKGRFTTTHADFATPQEVVNSKSDPARSVGVESRVYIFGNVLGLCWKQCNPNHTDQTISTWPARLGMVGTLTSRPAFIVKADCLGIITAIRNWQKLLPALISRRQRLWVVLCYRRCCGIYVLSRPLFGMVCRWRFHVTMLVSLLFSIKPRLVPQQRVPSLTTAEGGLLRDEGGSNTVVPKYCCCQGNIQSLWAILVGNNETSRPKKSFLSHYLPEPLLI